MKSEYYKSWDEFTAENPDLAQEELGSNKLQAYEDMIFKFVMGLMR